MHVVGRLHISTILYVLFGVSAALLSWQALYAVSAAISEQYQTQRVAQMARVNRELFAALQAVRVQRGPTSNALQATPAADPAFLASLPPLRAATATAAPILMAACKRIDCGSGDAASVIQTDLEKMEALYSSVDAGLRVPLAGRQPGIAGAWLAASSALVDELQRVSSALIGQIRMVDPVDSELMAIEQTSYAVRDAAGLDRNDIEKAMDEGAVSPDLQSRMDRLRGQVDTAWGLLQALVGHSGVPAPIMAAVQAAKQDYFDTYVKQRDAIGKALSGHTKLPMSENDLLISSNHALDVLVHVPNEALNAVILHSEMRSSAARRHLLFQSALLLASLSLAAVGFLVVWRRIARPIDMVTAAMLRVADGDLAAEVPYTDRSDEVGHLAQALIVFKQNAIEKQQYEAEQQAERRSKEVRVARLEALARSFEAKIRDLVSALSTSATEMETTATSMNATAEQTDLQSSTVASAAEEASANVQTVAAAADELSASISEIGRQIAHSNDIINCAVADVRGTDETVQSLSAGAQKIGDVVKLIEGIAGQTNLLALNATIEAARAGEAGKGFAVVASEVKALAGQTGKATEEIIGQVTQIQEATQRTVEAIRGIGATIAEVSKVATSISAAVEEQGVATTEIARNVQQAAEGTNQVSQSIVSVQEATSATGSAAAQVLAAAGETSRRSADLSSEVDAFLAGLRAV